MKIVWMLDNINTLNGMVQVVIGLSNHFAEKGYDVRINSFFSQESTPFFSLDPKVTVRNLGKPWNYPRMRKIKLLGQLMSESDADILLTCNEWAHTAAVLNKKKFKGKLILTQHLSCDRFSGRRKVINGLLHRFADAVAVLTEYDKRFYEKLGMRNVTVIPNAVYISPQGGDRMNVLISVGRVEREKGFDMLISAFAQTAKDFPDWKLRICGDGSQRKQLLEEIDTMGLSHQIEMPGITNQVPEELSKSSVFVMSSRWEGLPLAMIEAMASGNAIVAFDLPCTKDILSADSALVVPSDDVDALANALRKMMSDELLRAKCGAAAKADSQKYSVENIGKMWLDLFDKLQ